MVAIDAEYNHRTDRFTDHILHRVRAAILELTAPAKYDEVTVALSREIDDSQAGFALSERETDVDSVPCAPYGAQPIEELVRPCRPLVLRLVDITRRNQRPGLGGPLGAGCSDMKHHEFGCGHRCEVGGWANCCGARWCPVMRQ